MAEIKKIKVNGLSYDIADENARKMMLPLNSIVSVEVTIDNQSGTSGVVVWCAANKAFALYDATTSKYYATWAAIEGLPGVGGSSFLASKYYTQDKMYLIGTKTYAFVNGVLSVVGDGFGDTVDTSNFLTKSEAEGAYAKKSVFADDGSISGDSVSIGPNVTLGDGVIISFDEEVSGIHVGAGGYEAFIADSTHIGPGVGIDYDNENVQIEANVKIEGGFHSRDYIKSSDIAEQYATKEELNSKTAVVEDDTLVISF